jgi:dTDP-4-amino-4,6-dideoxygalactose transaminase
MQKGAWRYDVIEAGYKANMTDIQASIGLVELSRYDDDTLKKRQQIFEYYDKEFSRYNWAIRPVWKSDDKISSFHVYLLRIKNINEQLRDAIIQKIFDKEVSVNVHFQPLPLLSAYRNLGFDIKDFPVAYDNYSREISLPVYYDLNETQMKEVTSAIIDSVNELLK